MAITALPTPPNRNMTPEEFIAAADAFLEALPTFQSEANAAAEAMNLNDTSGTSATSNSIGTGAKTFTANTGKSWLPGMFIVIADTAAPSTNSMIAQITSYNSGTGALVVDVKSTLGSGTKTAWTISQTANPLPLDGSVSTASIADGAITYAKLAAAAIASLISATYSDPARPVPVRQTVLSGPVDSNGLPNFGGSTGSASVTMSGTLVATAANGTSNRTGSGTNLAWTGLSTNGTMYLYVDVNSDGTLTAGAGTLAPTYRWGGADVTTNGQFTFNIQEMTGKVGNGSAAAQAYRVYVGEVTVSGNVVTAITWYALMGRYNSTDTGVPSTTRISKNHNLGVKPRFARVVLVCTTTDLGYAVGEELEVSAITNSTGARPTAVSCTALTIGVVANVNAIETINKATGVGTAITAANWDTNYYADRGW
jgi:hypothetical protein